MHVCYYFCIQILKNTERQRNLNKHVYSVYMEECQNLCFFFLMNLFSHYFYFWNLLENEANSYCPLYSIISKRVVTHIKLLPRIPTETNSTTLNLEIQPQLVLHFLTFKESHTCPPDLLLWFTCFRH